MKKTFSTLLITLFFQFAISQNVGISDTEIIPDVSAMLDISSNTKGLLIPRMTTIERTAILTPATGLVVYDTDFNCFYFYNGSTWQFMLNSGSGWNINGNSGTNPAINFIGTTDNVDFVSRTNNIERLRITSTGNVGIGTTTPSAQLHINDATISRMRLTYGGASTGLTIGQWVNEAYVWNESNQPLVFGTNGAYRMTITADGNVGIGTTTPAVKFAVGGSGLNAWDTDAWIERNIHVQGPELLTQGGRGRLRIGSAWGYNGLYTDLTSSGSPNDLVLGASSGYVRVGPGTGASFQSLIIPDGYVGIGTSTPTSFLDINDAGSNPRMRFRLNNSATGFTIGYNNGANEAYIWNELNGRMVFGTNSSYRMCITATGEVGIGTMAPTANLEVNNVIKLTNSSADPNDGKIGTAPFAAGLNIVGINTDAAGRKINFWGSFIQNENASGNSFIGNTYFPWGIWNAAGNVGIGTTTPIAKLHVYDPAVWGGMLLQGGTATDGVILKFQNANNYWYSILNDATGNGFSIYDMSAGAYRFYITPLGNIGIGTTSPSCQLHINEATISRMRLTYGGAATGLTMGQWVNEAFIWNESNQPLVFGTNNSYRMTITAAGNVGIGTTTPSYKLHVYDPAAWGGMLLQGGTAADGVSLKFLNANNYWYNIGIDAGGNGFSIYDMSAGAYRFYMTSAGNVGLGTTTPGAKLEVAGQVKITGGAPGSGKVLTSDASGLASWQTVDKNCAFSAIKTTTTAVGVGNVIVIFDAEQFDLGNNYDPVTGTFTAPAAGVYQFNAGVYKVEAAGTNHAIQVFKNGVFIFTMEYWVCSTNNNNVRNGSFLLNLNAGETVQIACFQNAVTNVIAGANNFFSGFRVQ